MDSSGHVTERATCSSISRSYQEWRQKSSRLAMMWSSPLCASPPPRPPSALWRPGRKQTCLHCVLLQCYHLWTVLYSLKLHLCLCIWPMVMEGNSHEQPTCHIVLPYPRLFAINNRAFSEARHGNLIALAGYAVVLIVMTTALQGEARCQLWKEK